MDIFDQISFYVHVVASFLGVVFNLIFIALICSKTTKALRSYWVLLINVASTDLLCAVSAGVVMTRVMTFGDNLCLLFHGPCKFVGPTFCFYAHSFLLHTLTHCAMLTVVSFVYRFRVIANAPPSRAKLWLLVILVYLPSFTQFVTYPQGIETNTTVINSLKHQRPDVDFDDPNSYKFTQSIFTPFVAGCCTYLFVLAAFSSVMVLYMRRRVNLILCSSLTVMSTSTKKTHATLIKALSVQASLPFLMYVADLMFTATYVLPFLDVSAIENAVFLMTSVPPAVSPLLYIYYVRPYWLGLSECLHKLLGLSTELRRRRATLPATSFIGNQSLFADSQNNTNIFL